MATLTKEDLEKHKNINPTSFLAGSGDVEEDDSPIIKDDNEPIKKEEPKDPPAKQLKNQLEKTKKELEEARNKLKTLESKAPEDEELIFLKPVAEYLKKKAGKIDEEVVKTELIEKNRERKKALQEKEQKLSLKDQELKELSIERSEEWQNDYLKPISSSRDNLIASIVNLDDNGKIRNPEIMQGLLDELVKSNENGEQKSPVEIRQIIKVFANKFEKATGLEYDVPILREVVDAVSSFREKISIASKAKSDWEASVDKKRKEKVFEEESIRRVNNEKELKARDYYFNKYKSSIDAETIDSFIPSDEFIKAAEEEHTYMKSLLSGDRDVNPRQYSDFIDLAAKGKMFDRMSEIILKLEEEVKTLRGDKKSPRFNGGVSHGDIPQKKIDTSDYNPTGFLR